MKTPDQFKTTNWSCVVRAGQESAPDRHEALQVLCQRYWMPLYALARRNEASLENAQDLVQAFFAELLERNYLNQADAGRGRFRSFLMAAFKNFAAKQWQHQRTIKRGGSKRILSLDFHQADSQYSVEPETSLTAEQQFDRSWAITLLHHVWTKLQDEVHSAGHERQFALLKNAVLADEASLPFEQIAAELGISQPAARMAATRLRKRYRQLLRAEIADTLADGESIENEIQYLFAVLARH